VGRHENAAERFEIISIAGRGEPLLQESAMHLNLSLAPLIALLAGILILVMPRLLNYIVALYLIITGVLGLMGGTSGFHLH
jgi:hypothetical protein